MLERVLLCVVTSLNDVFKKTNFKVEEKKPKTH